MITYPKEYRVSKKNVTPQNVFITVISKPLMLISVHSKYPIIMSKNECSIFSESAKGAGIFDFSYCGGVLKKYIF